MIKIPSEFLFLGLLGCFLLGLFGGALYAQKRHQKQATLQRQETQEKRLKQLEANQYLIRKFLGDPNARPE